MLFGDFAGNAAVKKQLATEWDAGRIPHALLLEGEPGSGRRTLALRLARAAVCGCTDPASRPCGVCPACRKPDHPDITVYGKDGQTISVDTVRQLRQEAYVLPNEAPVRVMILANAQSMTVQAQNALLKILEEPPSLVRFILTCENRAQLLETIRSRCVCLTLGAVPWEEAEPLLTARLPGADPAALQQAHTVFGGVIGPVLAGAEDGALRRVLDLAPQMAAAVIAPEELPLMRLTAALEKDKELTDGVLAGLRLIFRDALAIAYGSDTRLSTAPAEAQALAARLTPARLMALLEQTDALRGSARRSMNNTLLLTRICACLRRAAGF